MTAQLDDLALISAHCAIEDVLIEYRDLRLSVIGPANGFVVREKDATPSGIMRIGTREGLRIAITAYLNAVADPEAARTELEARRGGTA